MSRRRRKRRSNSLTIIRPSSAKFTTATTSKRRSFSDIDSNAVLLCREQIVEEQTFATHVFDGHRSSLMYGAQPSPFAQFVYEGGDDDQEEDERESELWKDCQNLY